MNDFAEIENELKKLRPVEPSPAIFARVEADLREPVGRGKIVRPRFQINWVTVGATLAAAAVLLLFALFRFNQSTPAPLRAAASPAPMTRSTIPPSALLPAGTTQVVYRTEDEGLLFPSGSEQPMRRWRARTRETLRWQNPATGASLRVSYPAEEVTLVPVYGQ